MYLGSPFGAEQVTRNGEISNDKVMIEQLLQRGWSYDAEQMLLHPALIGEDEGQPSRLHAGDVRGLRGMDSLVGLVGFLGE